MCIPDLDVRIIQERLNMKVKLTVKGNSLRKYSLRKAVRGLDCTAILHKFDLSGNDLRDEGESLGQLMARMTTLRVLDVWNCNIQADTVHAMVQTVKEIKVTSGLHALYMGRYGYRNDNNNNLQSGGSYLGEMVALMPDLYTLDLHACILTDRDLVNMSGALPDTTNIRTLNLRYSNLDSSSEGLVSLLSHTPHIHALLIGGLDMPVPIPCFCRAVDAGFHSNLHVLDISWGMLRNGSLEKLGQYLQYMNKLQVINLMGIKGAEPEDYQHVYMNLPPSIQHLNMYAYNNLDVYVILEHQQHLNHLHRLNVNLEDSDIELLQEVLEQNNPQIHVYNVWDDTETWKMYVKDKDENKHPVLN